MEYYLMTVQQIFDSISALPQPKKCQITHTSHRSQFSSYVSKADFRPFGSSIVILQHSKACKDPSILGAIILCTRNSTLLVIKGNSFSPKLVTIEDRRCEAYNIRRMCPHTGNAYDWHQTSSLSLIEPLSVLNFWFRD